MAVPDLVPGNRQAVEIDEMDVLLPLLVLDIFSRYKVGWMVADRENSALVGRFIEETYHKQGVQPQVLTLHSVCGTPMTRRCIAQLLVALRLTRSMRHPQVSNDNQFSEV